MAQWPPTFETYLGDQLATYGCKTKVVPLDFDVYGESLRHVVEEYGDLDEGYKERAELVVSFVVAIIKTSSNLHSRCSLQTNTLATRR